MLNFVKVILLKCSGFTMFCVFLLFIKIISLYMHIYHIFLFIFFSIMIYYQILNIASCVIQQDFAAYPFYVVIQLSSLVQLFAARQGCSTPVFPESPNSCPVSWRCHPTNSSSVTPFSSCPQSFLESGSFPMNWLLPSGGQSIEVSASASVLSMTIQD